MDESKLPQAELAGLLGVIERLGGEISLAEEPSRFIAALESGLSGPDLPAGGSAGATSGPPR
jgi:hypothetical protein